jgi:hypothetical protein
LAASVNSKGVLDIDTVKGCEMGMSAYPDGGCYGNCYAATIAARYRLDFTVSVKRELADWIGWHRDAVIRQMLAHPARWYRIGVFGDPCHAWDHTVRVCSALRPAGMVPVIVTKHWRALTGDNLSRLGELGAVVQTSVSGMDSDGEIRHRLTQFERIRASGLNSVLRVVTCSFGKSVWADRCADHQRRLLQQRPVINTPFRIAATAARVASGEIRVTRRRDSIGGGRLVSLNAEDAFLGVCSECPDQCGVIREDVAKCQQYKKETFMAQTSIFDAPSKFVHLPSVLGSGYEERVSKLALEDGIAHRAARKNMQKHSAIILLVDGEFAGFFTFETNHDAEEFCLLQSVIEPSLYTDELYLKMAQAVLDQNTHRYPAHMTTNPKSKFETAEMFESLGFETYMRMNKFDYMILGAEPQKFRMKLLAHLAMTNVWSSTNPRWMAEKKAWNEQIELAGANHGVANPRFATREGCWQGESSFSNVVTGRSHNSNASVLDPVVCEIVARFCMPKEGRRVYNPFGGGVQMGFVSASYGFDYIASEIRQNQCDANNKLCSDLKGSALWIQGDSAEFEPEGEFDLVFSCPPYYRVERYVDYDGEPPEGEINAMPSYQEFCDALFAGYRNAIAHLGGGCFFVVMVGDSRAGKDGGYLGADSETEAFMRGEGLTIYNKIVYLESEFTRLAQAKKTLHYRKWPKREQRIIMGYKGNPKTVRDRFATIGRL